MDFMKNIINVDWNFTIKIIQILVIGIIGSFIGWLQYQTNQQKLLMDLYDRRIKIYNYVNGLILVAVRCTYTISNDNHQINYQNLSENLSKFYNDIYEIDFLFTEELCKEIYSIADKVSELILTIEDYQSLSKEAEKQENSPYRQVTEARQKVVKIKDDLTQKRNDLKLKFSEEIKRNRFLNNL